MRQRLAHDILLVLHRHIAGQANRPVEQAHRYQKDAGKHKTGLTVHALDHRIAEETGIRYHRAVAHNRSLPRVHLPEENLTQNVLRDLNNE